jgi:hypothetical protein
MDGLDPEGKICAPATYCAIARITISLDRGKICAPATYCAIARITISLDRSKICAPGDLLRP